MHLVSYAFRRWASFSVICSKGLINIMKTRISNYNEPHLPYMAWIHTSETPYNQAAYYSKTTWLMDKKRNIPWGGYDIGMSRGHRPIDIPLPYSLSGILHFCPSAKCGLAFIPQNSEMGWASHDSCGFMRGPIEYSPQYSMACIPLKITHLWYK